MPGILKFDGVITLDGVITESAEPEFSPASLNPSAWFEALAITGTSDGSTLSTIPDLSGNSRDFAAVSGTVTYKANGTGTGKPSILLPANGKMQTPVFQQFPSLAGTVVMLSTPRATASNKQLLGTYNQATPNWLWYQTDGTVNHGYMGGNFFNARGDMDRLNRPALHAWRRSGATLNIYDGFSIFTSPTVTNSQQSNVRLYLGDNGNGANAEISAILVFPSPLSQTELRKVYSYLAKRYLGGKPVHLDCCGDSLTAGYTPGVRPYPSFLEDSLGYRFSPYNLGVSGDTISQVATKALTGADYYHSVALGDTVFVGFAGSNDINAGTSAATAYAAYRSLFLARPHTRKVVVTMLQRQEFVSTPAKETARTAFNDSVAANWQQFADAIARPDHIPELSDSSDTTYFIDGVHLTAAGYEILANCIADAIRTIPQL